jgi:ABC-2 type transport system permease protein
MTKLFRLAIHEFLRHVRRPSFILTTLLVPLIGAAITFGIGLTRNRSQPDAGALPGAGDFRGTIGYVDQSGLITQVPPELPASLFRAYPDEEAARAAVVTGAAEVFYLIPRDYLQTGAVIRYARQLGGGEQELFRALLRANLLGGDVRTAALLEEPMTLNTIRLDAAGEQVGGRDNTTTDEAQTFFVPYIFAMLLYMTIFFAASFLLQSVTEEKENRTIEILLTSIQPWQLLGGKVLGLGLLGLIQMVLWLVSGRLLLGASAGPLGLFEREFVLPWQVWVLAVVYFVLGYLFYASLMAGIGATVTNIREGGQITALMVFPFIIPLWFLGVLIQQPNGTLARVLSLIPFTAPVTMVIRSPLTDVAPLEIALSLLLLAASVVAAIWVAARLFRVSTLLAGKRLSGREIVRAIRQA